MRVVLSAGAVALRRQNRTRRARIADGSVFIYGGNDVISLLDELDSHTLSRVPFKMAVEEPCTRVVSLESNDHESSSRQVGGISSRRIDSVQSGSGGIVFSAAGSKNEEVVAVKMHWVRHIYTGVIFESDVFRCYIAKPCSSTCSHSTLAKDLDKYLPKLRAHIASCIRQLIPELLA